MRNRFRLSTAMAWARRIGGLCAFLAAWAIFSRFYVSPGGGTVPHPGEVFTRVVDLPQDPNFWPSAQLTVERGFLGLMVALCSSLVLGVLIARSRLANAAIEPLMSVLYPVPRIALFPLALIVLGAGASSQIALVAIECVFPLTLSVYAGVRGIDRDLLRVVQNVSAGPARTWALVLRMSVPSVLTGLRIAAPLMLTLTIATQMFAGGGDGLGYEIQVAASRIDTITIFALAMWIGAFGLVVDRLIVWADAVATRHQPAAVI